MYVVCVTILVKPEVVEAFVEATLDNARNTRREGANLRFDLLRAEEDPALFFLFEAYRAKEDFAAHQQTEHYLRWKEAVAGMMREPRVGVRHMSVFFGDGETTE